MVSSRPEKEMEEVLGKGEGEYNMLAEVERLLKDLLKYKEVLVTAMEGASGRMDVVEKKIEVFSRDKQNAEGKALELLKSGQDDITRKLLENIKPFEKNMAEISKDIEETSRLAKESKKLADEDNAFLKGTYEELKNHIEMTNENFKEMNKLLAKIERENEQTNKFKKILGELVKTLIE